MTDINKTKGPKGWTFG